VVTPCGHCAGPLKGANSPRQVRMGPAPVFSAPHAIFLSFSYANCIWLPPSLPPFPRAAPSLAWLFIQASSPDSRRPKIEFLTTPLVSTFVPPLCFRRFSLVPHALNEVLTYACRSPRRSDFSERVLKPLCVERPNVGDSVDLKYSEL